MSTRAAWLPFTSSRRVASVRLRSLNPVDMLRNAGEQVRILHGGPPDPAEVLVLQKAYESEHLDLARRHHVAGGAVVLDLCDNHFDLGGGSRVLVDRASRLRQALDIADVVSVCTDELAEVVDHPVVRTVNDALDPVPPRDRTRDLIARTGRKPRILWFGTAGAHDLPFGIRDLNRILPALGEVALQHPVELAVMSNSWKAYRGLSVPTGLRTRYVPWGARRFAMAALASDVAVIPVEINAVTRGKTSNRVATAFQHGLAVVADPLPSYMAFSDCVRLGDFTEGVLAYLRSDVLRARHVARGRSLVEQIYSPQRIIAQWLEVLRLASQSTSR